jgi:hypothetical protein
MDIIVRLFKYAETHEFCRAVWEEDNEELTFYNAEGEPFGHAEMVEPFYSEWLELAEALEDCPSFDITFESLK